MFQNLWILMKRVLCTLFFLQSMISFVEASGNVKIPLKFYGTPNTLVIYRAIIQGQTLGKPTIGIENHYQVSITDEGIADILLNVTIDDAFLNVNVIAVSVGFHTQNASLVTCCLSNGSVSFQNQNRTLYPLGPITAGLLELFTIYGGLSQ